jgi:hypothetical protein
MCYHTTTQQGLGKAIITSRVEDRLSRTESELRVGSAQAFFTFMISALQHLLLEPACPRQQDTFTHGK